MPIKVYVAKQLTKQDACETYGRFAWGFGQLCELHNKRCARCGVSRMEHAELDGPDNHPHFNDNLEMLEWETEKREVSNNG